MAMNYNGTKLAWDGFGEFKASSGKAGLFGAAGFQEPRYQNVQDKGPIPEGDYQVPLKMGGPAQVNEQGELLASGLVVQDVPTCVPIPNGRPDPITQKPAIWPNFPAWGRHRVRLNVVQIKDAKAQKRSGFYIHDSVKGQSSGCIEVDTALFTKLAAFINDPKNQGLQFIDLKVDYTGATSTNGWTERPMIPDEMPNCQ